MAVVRPVLSGGEIKNIMLSVRNLMLAAARNTLRGGKSTSLQLRYASANAAIEAEFTDNKPLSDFELSPMLRGKVCS